MSTERTLSERVAVDLENRIQSGSFEVGERLPGELRLVEEYGVSRATIRTALKDLESRGLIAIRRGFGAIVTPGSVRMLSDLGRLTSMTESIAGRGFEPGMSYRSLETRAATDAEREALELDEGASVLATERRLTADGELVAFSTDTIPLWCLGDDLSVNDVHGSLFALLESHGIQVATAVAELHADHGDHVGWGERPADASYLVLAQIHYDVDARAVALARTAFIEGRFQFAVVRRR